MAKYFFLFSCAFLLSLILTPLVRAAAAKMGALDYPGGRKIHRRTLPRLGGLSIFLAFHLVTYAAPKIDFFYFPPDFLERIHFRGFFAASAVILALGAVDDFRRIPPWSKFLFQVIAGLIVALTSDRIEILSLPFGDIHLGGWAIPATVFWVVAVTNALNLLDGLDGLAAGVSIIAALSMFGISILNQNFGLALISVILAGSILGFLRYNFFPASIFLGDSGSYFLGFALSVLSLQTNLKETTTLAILVPILALGLPIMDTFLSMLRRLLKSLRIVDLDHERNLFKFFIYKGRSMFEADRDHIHHRLLKMGFHQKNAVVLLYAVAVLLGALALSSVYFRDLNQALLVTAIGLASYIGIQRLGYSEIRFLRNGSLLPLIDSLLVSRRIMMVFIDIGLIALSYYLAILLRFEGRLDPVLKTHYLSVIPLILAVKMPVFYLTGLYRRGWRHIYMKDLLLMLKALVLGCIAAAVLQSAVLPRGVISWAVLCIDFNLLFIFIVGVRSSFQILEHLCLSSSLDLSPAGFQGEVPSLRGNQPSGYSILGKEAPREKILERQSLSEVVISDGHIPAEHLDGLPRSCRACPLSLGRFPSDRIEAPFED